MIVRIRRYVPTFLPIMHFVEKVKVNNKTGGICRYPNSMEYEKRNSRFSII